MFMSFTSILETSSYLSQPHSSISVKHFPLIPPATNFLSLSFTSISLLILCRHSLNSNRICWMHPPRYHLALSTCRASHKSSLPYEQPASSSPVSLLPVILEITSAAFCPHNSTPCHPMRQTSHHLPANSTRYLPPSISCLGSFNIIPLGSPHTCSRLLFSLFQGFHLPEC